MIRRGKHNVLGVLVDVVDYDAAVEEITDAAAAGRSMAVTALAVHGVMTGVQDAPLRRRLNAFDLVTPDGQPVRWALNWLHGAGLADRVYGPDLTRKLLSRAAQRGLPVFFYGSTSETLDQLVAALGRAEPALQVAGTAPSRFRLSRDEDATEIAATITASGARLVFVGLGCPRQEQFVAAMRSRTNVPLIAVGAAFDYLAGTLPNPPARLQRWGLEWLWRLAQEPRRLWRRYVLLNPAYLTLLLLQRLGLHRPDADADATPPSTFPV